MVAEYNTDYEYMVFETQIVFIKFQLTIDLWWIKKVRNEEHGNQLHHNVNK